MDGPKATLEPPSVKFLASAGDAAFSLAPGPWVSAGRAASYLSEYPYGCLEQTVSRAFGFLAAPALGELSPKLALKSQYGLKAAVNRLAAIQTPSGGFSFWPNGQDIYEWGSAYAAHFLTEAKDEVELPHGLLADALGYLRNYLSSATAPPGGEAYLLSAKAYALYVLALNGEYQAGWINSLAERAPRHTPSTAIFLAAAKSLKAGDSKDLNELDFKPKKPEDAKGNLSQYRSSLETQARNAALLLLAYTAVDPGSPRARELAEIVAKDGAEGRWASTQENAMAAFSLANFIKKTKAAKPYKARLTSSAGDTLGEATEKDMVTFKGPELFSALTGPLTVTVAGEGRPWISFTVSGVPLEPPAPLSEGLYLEKTWEVDDEIYDLSAKDEPLNIRLARGQKIVATLTLSALEPLQNVALVDPLPGGLEIVNPKVDDEEGPSAQAEAREDRLVMIIRELGTGKVSVKYVLRAVTAGNFVLPPTVAEGMYQPDKKAILPTGVLTIDSEP
jgi:uncharacterized protein YfaS (alpha-2-macroglobulin family)